MPPVQRILFPIRSDNAPLMGAIRPRANGMVVKRRPPENAVSPKTRSKVNGIRKEQAEQNDVGQQADQISACEGPFLEQQQRNKRIGSATFPDDESGQQNGA